LAFLEKVFPLFVLLPVPSFEFFYYPFSSSSLSLPNLQSYHPTSLQQCNSALSLLLSPESANWLLEILAGDLNALAARYRKSIFSL